MKLNRKTADLLAFCRHAVPVLNLAGAWIDQVGDATARRVKPTRSDLTATDIHSAVTAADLLGQETILHHLLSRYPDLVPLAEEDTYHNRFAGRGGAEDRKYLTLDPVDGTLAFTRDETDYCSMLAVFDAADLLLGMIHFPALTETCLGVAGAGLFAVEYGTRREGNPWQRDNFQLQPLRVEPCSERKTLAVHYRFLLEPFDALAHRLQERGFSFKTLTGAPPGAVKSSACLGSNGALLIDLLRGGSAAFIGPFIALHDVAALAAMMKCVGTVRFYDAAGVAAARWTPIDERRVIAGIIGEDQRRLRVIMAPEEQVIDEIEDVLWG